MVVILIIEKNGTINEMKVKDLSYENLYKKCKFKKSEGFEKRNTWKNVIINKDKWNISLYARDFGKANTENKYDLPPPVDKSLYFGSMILIAHQSNDDPVDLSKQIWEKIYEKLFGGFENLADTIEEDNNEEDELQNIPTELKTKHGYLKDDFIVDDKSISPTSPHSLSEEDEELHYESELDFEEYEDMEDSDSDSEYISDE